MQRELHPIIKISISHLQKRPLRKLRFFVAGAPQNDRMTLACLSALACLFALACHSERSEESGLTVFSTYANVSMKKARICPIR